MFDVKQEFYVTLNVKDFDMECRILKLFEDTIEVMDSEDPLEKHQTYEITVKTTWEELMKYKEVRKIMLS